MTEIADTFPKASFGGITFPYTDVEISGSLDHHVHKYIHRPGGEVETLGRHLYEIGFSCVFDTSSRKWANLYPGILSALIALCETEGTYDLVIPNRGVRAMKCKAIKWDTNYTTKIRSGEKVKFRFLEDTTDQFGPYQVAAIATADLSSRVIACQQLARQYALPNPSIFDQLAAAISNFQLALDQVENNAYQAIASMDLVLALCDDLLVLPVLLDPINCAVFLAFSDLFDASLQVAADVSGLGRTVDVFFVEKPMSVTDLSMLLYKGDPSRVVDLLSLNSFNNPFLIPAASLVNWYVI